MEQEVLVHLLFLVRWEKRSRNYRDKFDGCIDIEKFSHDGTVWVA